MPTTADLSRWLEALAETYAQHKDHLTSLDAAIGDADHGINLDRGFQAVRAELAKGPASEAGALFKSVALTLIKTVGGAAGPLYGTFFLRAAGPLAGQAEVGLADLAEAVQAGLAGVIQRGQAQVGDKTMVDALAPAASALSQAAQAGQTLGQALVQAAQAAEAGMRATIPLVARKGRASYLGPRSAGHQDPGATSTWLLFQTLAKAWGEG